MPAPASAGRQLRLLLWKDYLVRKRKFVTLAGVAWATLVMLCLYIVRVNVDNQDFPTCQFPARALPSAGMLTFIQSFVCSVNNDCSPMDQYQEIPAYETSKLTQLQKKLSPLLYNETILEVAGSVPDALKLLATLADILDEPELIHLSKNGLKVQDLFTSPGHVRRYIVTEMNVSQPVADSIMASELTVQGILKGGINTCSADSISSLLRVDNKEYLETFVAQLCQLTDKQLQKLATDLLMEINFSKYTNMIGKMYFKLSGDKRILVLAELVTAGVRVARLESYLPPALIAMVGGSQQPSSYFNVSLVTNLMNQFEPTFGNTPAYKILTDLTDTIAMGIEFLNKIIGVKTDPVGSTVKLVMANVGKGIDADIEKQDISKVLSSVIDIFANATANESIDVFKILSQLTNFINKLMSDKTRHDVQFYSTLLAKLIEGANQVVSINWNIKEMAYDVSRRNPEGVRVLMSLPLHIVRKGYEALADAERVQILTSKLNFRGQIFCDNNKLAAFFKVSLDEASSLKGQLCTDAWKNYVGDLIRSFGVYDVRDLINNMASLVIQETFGKDTSDQLYSIDKDFQILKNFTQSLIRVKSKNNVILDWKNLFNVTDNSDFMKIFNERAHLGKEILITVHGALAKEVVKQNSILEYKISPVLLDFTTMVEAINSQLKRAPADLADRMKKLYPDVVMTMLSTLKNEEKTYRALATPSSSMVCAGAGNASTFLELSAGDEQGLVSALCDASRAIDAGLQRDSVLAKAIATVKNSTHNTLQEVNWTKLITSLKQLYLTLDRDYPYLFEFSSYGMDEETRRRVEEQLGEAKLFWFSTERIDRGVHLSVKLLFRLLDLVDSEVFGLREEGWLRLKFAFKAANGPLGAAHGFLRLLIAPNAVSLTDLPPGTGAALAAMLPGVPHLIVDALNIIVSGDTNLEPFLALLNSSTPWPCGSSSVSTLLPLSSMAQDAVRAAETIMCIDDGLQEEWTQYIKEKDLNFYNTSSWNTTVFEPHIFLKFSGTLDALVKDAVLARAAVQELINGIQREGDRLTVADAWRYAAGLFDGVDRNATLKTLFANIDTILTSLPSPTTGVPLSSIWAELGACRMLPRCGAAWRAAWKHSLQAVSVVLDNLAGDLLTYFTEINEPGASLLQVLGFTRATGLHVLFDRLPEFVGALLNSFWDYGFMSQVRRASLTQFWDCEAVLAALAPAAGSGLDAATIAKVQPFVCPTLLHWLSLPRGENTFLDIVAKPQYIFYNLPVQNLTSSYEGAFLKATKLSILLKSLANNNASFIKKEDTSIETLQNKLKETVDKVLNYRINETDPSYRLFNEINKKQFVSATYLTRITAMVNKLSVAIENLKPEDIKTELPDDEVAKFIYDISAINRIFKRRPNEAIAFHFDVITDLLSKDNNALSLVNVLEATCGDINSNDTSKDILSESQRTKNQICDKDYKAIFGAVEGVIADDFADARKSYTYFINVLQDGDNNMTDIAKFFRDRHKLVKSMRSSIKYAYDLSLPIYLKYLQSNLQNYNVVLSFLAGQDWWAELRQLYHGPRVGSFFEAVEKSLEIAEDILTQLDKIQLVRLLRDVNLNSTASFCQPNISLAEYIPDGTGALGQLKQSACEHTSTQLFQEIPALVFASQGYDDQLTLSKDIDYTSLNGDIYLTESRLELIRDEPKPPQRPGWVTTGGLDRVKAAAGGLLEGGTLVKIGFGVIGNVIDAGTLFLNDSQCALCSQFTTWVKQINLQLYKQQEYESLLHHLHTMSLEEVHYTLKNDFHWDMALRELISSRNYTRLELNKSLRELLRQVQLAAPQTAPEAHQVLTVLAQTTTLLRAELPHLHEVAGMSEVAFFKEMLSQVAPRLDVYAPLKEYLDQEGAASGLGKVVGDEELVKDIESADVNLRLVNSNSLDIDKYMRLERHDWSEVCQKYDCREIVDVVNKNVNRTSVSTRLPTLQASSFWRFELISRILEHVGGLLMHLAQLASALQPLDLRGVARGEVAATVDLAMELMTDDTLTAVVDSIHGILNETASLLNDSLLARDLRSLTAGMLVLREYKQYLVNEDITVRTSDVFGDPSHLEAALASRGINSTNFWSVAAPRLQQGDIHLTPLLSWPSGSHISSFVCTLEPMALVLQPADLLAVSRDDVLGAVAEQFCGLPDQRVKELLPVLIQGLNFTYIIDKVSSALLSQLYSAAELSPAAGARVQAALPAMAAALGAAKDSVGDVARELADEPLMKTLANFSSVAGLLGESSFLYNAGNMVCGKPFSADVSRVYKAVLQNKDLADQPDRAQLDALPTEFCRSLYKGIVAAEGGKIVWSFIKPLVMGKILYTPATPHVLDIIRKANSSFAHMGRLSSLVHSFADAFSSVDKLSVHRSGVRALRDLLAAPAFRELGGTLLGGAAVPDVNVDEMFDEFGDLQGVGGMLSRVSSLLRCISLDRFHAAADEEQLTHRAAQLAAVDEFSAGLVFLDAESPGSGLTNVQYKIRMDIDNTPTTARMKNYLWIPGPEANFLEHMRYFRGFVQLQDMVDRAIVQLAAEARGGRRKREVGRDQWPGDQWAVYTQQVPYPCYRKDFFQTSLYESQALIVAFFFSLLYSAASAVRFVVADREDGNTMLMSVMGVRPWCASLSWALWCGAELAAALGACAAVLKAGRVLPRTDAGLLLALLACFLLAVLAMCYMLSKLFRRASVAAVVSSIVYLITFMPIVLILSLEAVISKAMKILICLSMSSSLCYAFLHIARYEAMGVGAGWAQLWVSPTGDDDVSIGLAAILMLVDAAIYFAIGYTIDYFFGLKSLQTNITYSATTHEKAGVSIVNVSKAFGSRRALHNVSVELRRGHVTALLGHNGAGKTTLIKILTGMLKPSSGHVIIRSQLGARGVGVCPQRDVLHAHMSAREHVALYAQLKTGLDARQLRDEIESMLSVLCLGGVCGRPVRALSGGTRRRLCVALAFVGRPGLVALDEPTAGVDPKARRDIWSMIVKLRAERTVLLTTHHLDEAELLSDQLVIMHKGEVHTTGTPIEIKRTLGHGYRLSVTYPAPPGDYPALPGDYPALPGDYDPSMEERVKKLLAASREVVANAGLVDSSGLEAEISLPFFDANGLNNNFLQLCELLESRQAALGFSSLALDCGGLEHVLATIGAGDHAQAPHNDDYVAEESVSPASSTSSVRAEPAPLVGPGPVRGSRRDQLMALLRARYIHYCRNRWLSFVLLLLPALFVCLAMAFSLVRPPPDNEVALPLTPQLYAHTHFLTPNPSVYSDHVDPSFAKLVMHNLIQNYKTGRNWTEKDTPSCSCGETRQDCAASGNATLPDMMALPDVGTLNRWLVNTQEEYIEKRYGGFTSALQGNHTLLTAWYNNKGHHALPSYVGALYTAALRAAVGDDSASITTYSHPLKISTEQISKDTVYQHVADAGISGLVLLAYCLVAAGGSVYAVGARTARVTATQRLAGVPVPLAAAAALLWDMLIIVINMVITAALMELFHFPVFVAGTNLPAICLLILLYGYACGCLMQLLEKLFSEASVSNMVLFCANAFLGLGGLTLLLILDLISQSESTDNARWVLHKVFLLAPPFALGDGLLEIAKNTIQAQVLGRFGMNTYKDPFSTDLVVYHYLYLLGVGTALFLINLAVEYSYFDFILAKFRSESVPEQAPGAPEDAGVACERARVRDAALRPADAPLRLRTIGNINAGFVDTENEKSPDRHIISSSNDVAYCVSLSKVYPTRGLRRPTPALSDLTLGMPPGICTALLGENGAGKSTAFAILTGGLRPSAGHVYLNDQRVKNTQLCKGLISYCPQNDAIDPLLTVRETLSIYCQLRGIADQDEVIRRTLSMFELARYAFARCGTLSGGNKRKLCTALAFMGRAPLVLLDEPTSGMDPASRVCVARGVRAACGGRRAVLLSTHQLHDARRMAARVALLRRGTLQALATPAACSDRFGGGYTVECVVAPGAAGAVWRRVRGAAPHARLRVMHAAALHFHMPLRATVNQKEMTTRLSDIFRLMAELQGACDIDDYTVSQSSLEQMFLSFTDTADGDGTVDVEPLPAAPRHASDHELHSVTSL